jgi:phosphoadenosine phosphosulfate reductase
MTERTEDIIRQAFAENGKVTISFSGAEDVVLIDMACNLTDDVNAFCLDTGRLHPETYQFIEEVREHYGVDIDVVSPDGQAVADFVKAKGLYSFYEDGHQECCSIRKIAPLRQHLAHWDAWITGQRRDQSPTRSEVQTREQDKAFSTPEHVITKYNPLADWTSAQVWQYIRDNQVPYNKLHDRGYMSIGCEPCTRAIRPNEHERAGRWWWEEATKKECGLHVIKVEEA